MYSYNTNKRAQNPANLFISGIKKGEVIDTLLNKSCYQNWIANFIDGQYIDHMKKEELVYLTADSPNTIDKLDETKVYIIGGIVDRNRYPNLTFDKAEK